VFVQGGNVCQQGQKQLKLMKSITPPAKVFKVERDPALNELH
jgi:hypothetical protein